MRNIRKRILQGRLSRKRILRVYYKLAEPPGRSRIQTLHSPINQVSALSFETSLLHAEALRTPARFATRLRLGGYPQALPRFPATTASSDCCFRFRYSQSSQVPLQNFRSTPPPLPRAGPCGRLCRRLRRPPLRASPFGACALSHLNRVGAEVLVSRIQRR